ncbi:MAG: alpha/beta hydrolase [Actinomycetota bacterium]
MPSAVEPLPVVVLVHGGFWSDRFGRQLMDPLALDLASSGYAVWNIEYRRVGMDGGGWPTTFDDVAVAVDHLAVLAESTALDLERVAFVGHSAGGHLALWAAGREAIPSGETWSDPVVVPALAVGQAPVVDLATASIERAGGGAVDALLGGAPADVPERYAAATPDPGVSGEILIVLAAEDSIVLPRWTGGAPEFEAAQVVVPDADHFSVIDPSHPSWAVVTDAIGRVLGPPAAG